MRRACVIIITIFLTIVLTFPGCAQRTADLILMNGKFVTVDEANPEAEAVAIRGGRILAIGDIKTIQTYADASTEVIDLNGALAVPGLTDAHGHFMSLGRAKMRLDLTNVNNWDEIVAMVQNAAAKLQHGEWILGRGWHQEKWDRKPDPQVEGLPVHHAMSMLVPDHPVFLTHASGHSAFANAYAMDLAGITNETENPPGGEIVRDRYGNIIGIFRETAQSLIRRPMSHYNDTRTTEQLEAERIRALELAVEECLSRGITSFHDAGVSYETIDFYKKCIDDGLLTVRLYAMISENNADLEERLNKYWIDDYGDHHLHVRSIKRLIDGALGAHGAWLLEPYKSLPTSVGLNTEAIEDMRETARIAVENGFQFNTHAIGDRGNRETLDIYEEVYKSRPNQKDLRWRVEHAQHLHPDDISRFAELGVIPSMQGIHCTSDGPWVLKRLGAQRAEEGAYVWRKLIDSGAVICNGTDVPVEPVDPISCYYASVTRRMKNGEAFYPDQCMTRMEALESYTINAAYAAFEEDIKGSLTPGKLADITVLSKDILTCPDDEILDTEILYTIVGGQVLYEK